MLDTKPGGFSKKPILIDAAGHIKGRLAAFVAKLLLQGQKVVVVRCEQIVLSGPFYRNKHIYKAFMRKRCNVNPRRGPFHFRAPSNIFYKCVRGMVPWKTKRGRRALRLLHSYEGVPPAYASRRLMKVPETMRVVRSDPANKFCYLGRVSHEVGWKYRDVVKKLERRRLIKKSVNIAHTKKVEAFKKKAIKRVRKQLEPFNAIKAKYGYE